MGIIVAYVNSLRCRYTQAHKPLTFFDIDHHQFSIHLLQNHRTITALVYLFPLRIRCLR